MEGTFSIYEHSMVIKGPNSAISYEQEEGDADHIYGMFINEKREVVDKFIENYKTLTKKDSLDIEITTEKQSTDINEVTSQDLTKQSTDINEVTSTVEVIKFKITVDGDDEDRKKSIISLMYLCGIKPENLDEKSRWPLMHLIHKGVFEFMR